MNKPEFYTKDFFSLLIIYAQKRAEIEDIEILESVKLYTPIYFLIGNYSFEFDPSSSIWIQLINRYKNGEDLVEISYSLHVVNYQNHSKRRKWYGCFGYKYEENSNGNGIIKIHFQNDGKSKEGPLASNQKENRLHELRDMFADIKQSYPNAKYVQGGSWLYNIEAYKRLFPKEFFADMKSRVPKTQILVIWGQFVNSEWEVKTDIADRFLNRLNKAKTVDDLNNAFEMWEFFPSADIKYFYSFYRNIS